VRSRLLIAGLLGAAALAAEAPFTATLWDSARPVYARTLEHPFLKGLADGTLARARFQFYLTQDALYLTRFSQALNLLAARAPREEWALTLSRHAIDSIETERQLHASILGSFGVTPAMMRGARMAPSNYAYTNHLLAVAQREPFVNGLAAMLPCYWIYWEVGKELKKNGSRNRDYQRWIDQYADPAYGKAVQQVLDMMNAEAGKLDPASREALKELFVVSARYEWMFWDMAWREEKWLP
jgi:thiaminase (transcriptional activator TenA)